MRRGLTQSAARSPASQQPQASAEGRAADRPMDAQPGAAREQAVARAVTPAVPAMADNAPVHSFMMPRAGAGGPGLSSPGPGGRVSLPAGG